MFADSADNKSHLIFNGFRSDYTRWVWHGKGSKKGKIVGDAGKLAMVLVIVIMMKLMLMRFLVGKIGKLVMILVMEKLVVKLK